MFQSDPCWSRWCRFHRDADQQWSPCAAFWNRPWHPRYVWRVYGALTHSGAAPQCRHSPGVPCSNVVVCGETEF